MTQETSPQLNVAAIAQQLAGMEQYINRLQQAIETISNKMIDARIAREVLERMEKYDKEDVMFAVDRSSNVIVRTKIVEQRPIVYLGLNVYAEIPFEKAKEILKEREKIFEEQVKKLQQDLNERVKEYQKLQQMANLLAQQSSGQTG